MTSLITRPAIAVAALLVAVGTGAAHAQLADSTSTRTNYLNCGGFTLTAGETVLIHASLDDLPEGRPARATVQLLDAVGAVQAQKEVLLQAGQSTTLAWTGSGFYRAHIEFREAALTVSPRRTRVALVEILDLTGEVGVVCVPIDNGVRPPPQ